VSAVSPRSPAADGSRAWIDALRPSLPDNGLVETMIFCLAYLHAIVRAFGFVRYLGNLAIFLFPAALPLVFSRCRPHQRAEDGGEGALDGVVRRGVGPTQKRVCRWLISWARPDIRSVAGAIWSRQRAITAGLDESMARAGNMPTAPEPRAQRPEASGAQRTGSRRAARLGD
jgi:hypothetical protein